MAVNTALDTNTTGADWQGSDLDLMSKPFKQLTERERHERLTSWFVGEVMRQGANRAEMAKDERYYDMHQISDAMRREIERRGQTVVQWDMITPQIDWLLGTERRMRIDEKVMPRRTLDEESTIDAENKTQVLKWIDDTNKTGYQRSAAWDDAMKAGIGWLEIFAMKDEDGWSVGKQQIPWKLCYFDSLNLEKTGRQQMRFFFRVKPVDLDIALAHFPHKRVQLLRCAASADQLQALQTWMSVPGQMLDLETVMGKVDSDPNTAMPLDMFNIRQRVLLVEAWSMEPYVGDTAGVSLDDPVRLRPHVTIMTEHDIIAESWSPYKHDQIPFVPSWAYADKTTGLPYSPIRRYRDRQDALNKAMSRALHDISVDQLHIEKGAIDDEVMSLTELRDELDDPAGIAIFKDGALNGNRVAVIKHTESAQAHLGFAKELIASIQTSSTVNRESTGGGLPGTSGTALGKREDQSNIQNSELFDGLILAHTVEGELTLSVMEQFMRDPLVIPTTSAQGVPQPLALNQFDPITGTYKNDLTRLRARYVITEQPWRASLGQAQFESLMLVLKDMAGAAPQVVLALLDTVFEYADIPNKQRIVERIRSVTGQQDPAQRPTPQQIQAAQRKQQMADMEYQAALAKLQYAIQHPDPKGEKSNADTLVALLESLGLAATVAMQAAANPALTPATDSILATVGFVDKHPAAGQPLAQFPNVAPGLGPAAVPLQPQPTPLPLPPMAAKVPFHGGQ
jgi:hypothetical protein